MATPSYSACFSSAISHASPASSFVSTKLVAWNPSERSFSWTADAISGCLPNPRMRQPFGREEEVTDMDTCYRCAAYFPRHPAQPLGHPHPALRPWVLVWAAGAMVLPNSQPGWTKESNASCRKGLGSFLPARNSSEYSLLVLTNTRNETAGGEKVARIGTIL